MLSRAIQTTTPSTSRTLLQCIARLPCFESTLRPYYVTPACFSVCNDAIIRKYSRTSKQNIPNRNGTDGAFKDLYGVPFSVSPEQALERFDHWARQAQGLNSFLMNWDNVQIAAAYTPVWTFTMNVRFVLITNDTLKSGRQRRRLDWKPEIFQEAYGTDQSVIHLPGLSAYAGHSYRRSLIDPLHNTSLLFLEKEIIPFGGWMLREMKLGSTTLRVFPDPWNSTRGRALSIVKDHLENLCNEAKNIPSEDHEVKIHTEVLSYRRVYMPTYVINYKVFPNMEFQAFVSGCDVAAGVSGVSHKISSSAMHQTTNSFLAKAYSAVVSGSVFGRRLGMQNRELATVAMILLQFAGSLLARLLSRITLLGFLGGLFVGFRKVIQPWMDSRWATADWERQREHEATVHVDHTDDFVDSGAAQRYFQANRDRILRYLSGREDHTRGDYNWYELWEKWARQQWEQQQQQSSYDQYQQQQQSQQQQSQQQRSTRQKQRTEYQWDFDTSDPYSVLGIARGASKQEVSAAFRKQMMTYHPDLHRNASEAEKDRAIERSKLITDAYRKIKAEMK